MHYPAKLDAIMFAQHMLVINVQEMCGFHTAYACYKCAHFWQCFLVNNSADFLYSAGKKSRVHLVVGGVSLQQYQLLYFEEHVLCDIFYASSKWMDLNPQSFDTAVKLWGHGSNVAVRLVCRKSRVKCIMLPVRMMTDKVAVMQLLVKKIFIIKVQQCIQSVFDMQ